MESPRTDAEFEPYRTVVVKRHVATDDTQLELHVNDIVVVLEKDHTGWWGGHKDGEDFTGWFPGFCVHPLPKEETPINPALERATASPSRHNQAVASPQRHGINAGVRPAVERTNRCSEVLLQEKSRECSLLDDEVAKLRKDKESLEEALRQAQQQNAAEKESCTRMVRRMSEVESKLQAETSERRATMLKCEQLEAELRHRDEEVATLRRLSVVSAMTMTPNAAALAQSPVQQTNDEGMRRRLFPSVSNATSIANKSEISTLAKAPSASPPPVKSVEYTSGACDASARTSSRSRGRRSEEEPPVGFVKQLRKEFEARSVTPTRSQSRGRAFPERVIKPGAWGISVTASAPTGGPTSSQGPRQTVHGYCPGGLAVSADSPADDIAYGMSPITTSKESKKCALSGSIEMETTKRIQRNGLSASCSR